MNSRSLLSSLAPRFSRTTCLLFAAFLALPLLLCGCATNRNTPPPNSRVRPQIEAALQGIFDAAEQKDWPRLDSFHHYGPSFSKFGSEAAERQDSEFARAAEHKGLGAVAGLQMEARDLKVDAFGQTAVATFILNYSFEAGGNTFRQSAKATMVFLRTQEGWKIVHEHLSPVRP